MLGNGHGRTRGFRGPYSYPDPQIPVLTLIPGIPAGQVKWLGVIA